MKRIDLQDWKNFDYSVLGGGACVVRYGAFGDMIQSSSVFPALKEQGFNLVVNTQSKGADLLRNDPYIDTLLVQKRDQVPNDELDSYWYKLSRPFDRFVNLSGSVEKALLAVQGDHTWQWHQDFRDLVFSVDYLDGIHAISECQSFPKRPKFYPNKKEVSDSEKFRRELGYKNKVIMYALSGSSLHKVWPHMDTLFARIMIEYPDSKIVTVGDEGCKLLEFPWKKEPRVIFKSGKWSIRQSLSFIPYCDVVVGPETGILNAAAYENVGKVIMLSHSSPLNIGGSWPNTLVITPTNCPCYPCHKLHYSWKTCAKDEGTGVAVCATRTSPDEVYSAVKRFL